MKNKQSSQSGYINNVDFKLQQEINETMPHLPQMWKIINNLPPHPDKAILEIKAGKNILINNVDPQRPEIYNSMVLEAGVGIDIKEDNTAPNKYIITNKAPHTEPVYQILSDPALVDWSGSVAEDLMIDIHAQAQQNYKDYRNVQVFFTVKAISTEPNSDPFELNGSAFINTSAVKDQSSWETPIFFADTHTSLLIRGTLTWNISQNIFSLALPMPINISNYKFVMPVETNGLYQMIITKDAS